MSKSNKMIHFAEKERITLEPWQEKLLKDAMKAVESGKQIIVSTPSGRAMPLWVYEMFDEWNRVTGG